MNRGSLRRAVWGEEGGSCLGSYFGGFSAFFGLFLTWSQSMEYNLDSYQVSFKEH